MKECEKVEMINLSFTGWFDISIGMNVMFWFSLFNKFDYY